MAQKDEKPGASVSPAQLDDIQPEVQDLAAAEAESVRGGLVFNFKLVAVKTVSWSNDSSSTP